MTARNVIQYIDLPTNQVSEGTATFFLEHIVQSSLPTPFDDPPHRHNFQEILVIRAGSMRHRIDGNAIESAAPTITLIAKGQVHVVESGHDLTAWIIRFTDDFLPAGLVSQTWDYHATLFNQLDSNATLAIPSADLHDFQRLLELLEAEYKHPAMFLQENVLRHLVSALMIRIERIYQQTMSANGHARDEYRVYQQFVNILDHHFARQHAVEFYAGALHLAPAKLSRMLRRIAGKPTKQLIDERIVLEARRYLRYTDLSITEIAFALGYNDLFHFSKTFKRLSGVPPQAFREQHEKLT